MNPIIMIHATGLIQQITRVLAARILMIFRRYGIPRHEVTLRNGTKCRMIVSGGLSLYYHFSV